MTQDPPGSPIVNEIEEETWAYVQKMKPFQNRLVEVCSFNKTTVAGLYRNKEWCPFTCQNSHKEQTSGIISKRRAMKAIRSNCFSQKIMAIGKSHRNIVSYSRATQNLRWAKQETFVRNFVDGNKLLLSKMQTVE
jgi:hypothetical protein